jgi:two-component system, cell cycle sensor histidine kinase PleC
LQRAAAYPSGNAPGRPWGTWAALALLACVMLGFGYRIERLGYERYRADLELATTLRMTSLRESISGALTDRILAINELATVLGENPETDQDAFIGRAGDILADSRDVVSVVAAPDLVASLVYPLAGNETVIGLDYRTNAEQWPRVQEAMTRPEGLVTGPVNLVQGGRGLILRKPVLLPPPEPGAPRPVWGLLSMVLDYDDFMAGIGVDALTANFDILIRESGNAGVDVLLGNTAVLGRDPIRLDFDFPFGRWEMAATTAGGWPAQRPDYEERWFYRLVLVALVMGGLLYVLRLVRKRREAEARLHHGVEALDHGFVMFDSDGKLVLSNSKYKRLHPMLETPVPGTYYSDLVEASVQQGLVPDAVGQEEEWLRDWFERQSKGAAEVEQILAGGRVIRTSDRRMPDGSIVGLRIDVTDLKHAQLAAEAANRAKTDFMGVLSHELRTPLTVILGQVRLARNLDRLPAPRALHEALEADPAAQAQFGPLIGAVQRQVTQMMEMAERSGTQLMTLINEVLDFAKIDSGSLRVERAAVTLAELVNPAAEQMRPHVEQKGLAFEVVLADPDVVIEADPQRIRQVLINLISNAVKFTDSGSIALTVDALPDVVRISVRDSGIGVPESECARVFDPFHQVDSTATRRHGGTGLGLAISRDIAQAHEGTLGLESVEGQGSTFTLTLPRANRDAGATLAAE